MRATWRPLPGWPYPQRKQQSSSFRSEWGPSLDLLESEIEAVGGDDVVIGLVCNPDQISISGALKAGGRVSVRHPGAEVSFSTKNGTRMVFHTDAFPYLQWNLRAIALGLEALRKVDRYGITSGGEQYAGFAAITAGGPDPIRGKALVERAGGLTEALKKHHPDQGGKPKDLADVLAYRETAGR